MLLEKFKRDLKVQNRSKKTMESIDQILGYAEKKLKKPIENLSIDELKNYFIKEQARGLNQNTVALTQAKFIQFYEWAFNETDEDLSLIHISEPTRLGMISYAVFCLKKKKK